MSDGDALLRTILAAPDDDAPRLIYADWLDENGEPDRAEFIRVQVELARMDDRRESIAWAQLHWRERKLMAHGCQECTLSGCRWVPAELHRPGNEWMFRRGFVAAVSLPCGAFVGGSCGTCNGYGHHHRNDSLTVEEVRRMNPDLVCKTCHGRRTAPGLAARLFAAQPVTAVVLSDKRPARQEVEDYWFWVRGREDTPAMGLAGEAYWIPVPLWQYLGKYEQPTEEAANADLSAACVRYGRSQAGLPPLPGPGGRPAGPAGG